MRKPCRDANAADVSGEESCAVLDFAQQRDLACADGWLQGRYYAQEGATVEERLAFDAVFGICPFEVGVDRRAERRAFRARRVKVVALLDLKPLLPRVFNTLSNGEMRRVLFARTLLTGARRLVLNDPMAGLDAARRAAARRVIAAVRAAGIAVVVKSRYADELCDDGTAAPSGACAAASGGTWDSGRSARPVVELNHLSVAFGKRKLFDDFSWKVRRGEHWVLWGPNGSGKTLLMAMISGDSPLAYANDVKVFGVPRAPGHPLAKIRRRIAMVSPEMQTYLDKNPFELLEEALRASPDLLILDEPCLNLRAADARCLLRRVHAHLRAHPAVTAIVIAHRAEHVPKDFALRVDLARPRG